MLVFLLLTMPLVADRRLDVYDDRDERYFHYPTTLAFVEQFPQLNLADYRSASTPLYYVLLAPLTFVVGSGVVPLRAANAAMGLACLLAVYAILARRGGALRALLFSAIFMMSPYFLGPAIRLSTDNLSLLFALLALAMTGRQRREDKATGCTRGLSANVLILLSILTRQIYAWLVGVYALVMLWSQPGGAPSATWRDALHRR